MKVVKQEKGVIYRVKFNLWNEKVVRCRLFVHHQNGELEGFYTFEGKAYCNFDAGDIFNLEVGEQISFNRAILQYKKLLLKMRSFYNKESENISKYIKYVDKINI